MDPTGPLLSPFHPRTKLLPWPTTLDEAQEEEEEEDRTRMECLLLRTKGRTSDGSLDFDGKRTLDRRLYELLGRRLEVRSGGTRRLRSGSKERW